MAYATPRPAPGIVDAGAALRAALWTTGAAQWAALVAAYLLPKEADTRAKCDIYVTLSSWKLYHW